MIHQPGKGKQKNAAKVGRQNLQLCGCLGNVGTAVALFKWCVLFQQ
jgi:hypothetical protein